MKRIGERSVPLTPVELQAVEELKAYLDSSCAPDRIVKRLKTFLESLPSLSAANAMRRLADDGIILKADVETWNKIRNRVMHGDRPTSRYSSRIATAVSPNAAPSRSQRCSACMQARNTAGRKTRAPLCLFSSTRSPATRW